MREMGWMQKRSRAFSALGRAVWDETTYVDNPDYADALLSVLSVEPYWMKQLASYGMHISL